MTIYAFYNQKGGAGKTAAAVNICYLSTAEGLRTLFWDINPQGAESFYFQADAAVRNGAKKFLSCELDLLSAVQPAWFN